MVSKILMNMVKKSSITEDIEEKLNFSFPHYEQIQVKLWSFIVFGETSGW